MPVSRRKKDERWALKVASSRAEQIHALGVWRMRADVVEVIWQAVLMGFLDETWLDLATMDPARRPALHGYVRGAVSDDPMAVEGCLVELRRLVGELRTRSE